MDARYRSLDGDPRAWKSGDTSGPKAKTHQGMVYAIQSPFTGELHYPPAGKCWRPEQREVLQWLQGWGCRYELRDIGDAQTVLRPALLEHAEDVVPLAGARAEYANRAGRPVQPVDDGSLDMPQPHRQARLRIVVCRVPTHVVAQVRVLRTCTRPMILHAPHCSSQR